MRRICLKHGLQPEVMRSFIKTVISTIEKTEEMKNSDPNFKTMKPYIRGIKDLLLNGDIPKEEKKGKK